MPVKKPLTKEQAAKLRAKRDAEDPLQHYTAPITLQKASQAKSRYVCVHAANQCLGYNSEIYDPVVKLSRKVGEITGEFNVYAWDEHLGEMVITRALPPEKMELDDIYRITLSNGLSFEASLGHRILCADGEWRALSQLPPECELYRPPSTLGNGQLIHVADGLHSTETAQDSQCDYRDLPHLGDAPLPLAVDSDLISSPLLGDAPQHKLEGLTRACEHTDAPQNKSEHSHPHQLFGRLSNPDDQHRTSAHSVASPSSLPLPSVLQYADQDQSERPQPPAGACQSPPSSASQEFGRPLIESSASPLRLVSSLFVRTDWKYDFEVPGRNNYSICGTLHHNCGKTAWMQYIAASILRGRNPNWGFFEHCKILLIIPSRAQACSIWGNRLLKRSELFGPMYNFPWIPDREIDKVVNAHSNEGAYPGKILMKNSCELTTILSGDPNSWKRLEGNTYDLVIRDEVAGSENMNDELQPRLLASRTRALEGLQPWGGVIIWGGTETKHNTEWLEFKQRCLDNVTDHLYFKPQPEEAAAYISMKAREEMKTTMSAESYRIRGSGTLDAGDLVRIFVKQWDDKRHMLKTDYIVKDDDNIHVSWDPGVDHPTGIVISAISRDAPNQLKVVKVFEHSNEDVDYDVECIHSFLLGRKMAAFAYDWAASARHKHAQSLLHVLIAKLEARGYVPLSGFIQADKRVEPGIDTLRHYLDPKPFDQTATPMLVLNPSTESGGPLLRGEFIGYCKTEETATSKGKIVKKDDDSLDCVRYQVRTFPYWSAAYCCGKQTYAVPAPMQQQPSLILNPHAPLSLKARREEWGRTAANRTRTRILQEFRSRR